MDKDNPPGGMMTPAWEDSPCLVSPVFTMTARPVVALAACNGVGRPNEGPSAAAVSLPFAGRGSDQNRTTTMIAAHVIRWRERGHAVIPGLLASAVIAVAAAFLSQHYGVPVMLLALLLGMAFHFLSQEGRCVVGIDIAAKHILRIGVGLLGAQVTLDQVVGLGAGPVLLAIFAVVLTIGFGVAMARLMRLDNRLGLLTGGAVAICGASAALAIASVLPKDGNAQRDTIFTVIGVTTLSTVAMILYPIVAALLHLDRAATGIFLGATIHDVAQVVGAAFSLSQEAG